MRAEEFLDSLGAAWMSEANCSNMDSNLFFPDTGLPYDPFVREVCGACPVQEDCLWYANETSSDYGMWGGMSPTERQLWRRRNDIALGDSREHYEWKNRQRFLHLPIEEWT
jgi:WhiB family redox-sensing transcriptional regulator